MTIIHIPTGNRFDNRWEAKKALGGLSKYNKAIKNREIAYFDGEKILNDEEYRQNVKEWLEKNEPVEN